MFSWSLVIFLWYGWAFKGNSVYTFQSNATSSFVKELLFYRQSDGLLIKTGLDIVHTFKMSSSDLRILFSIAIIG